MGGSYTGGTGGSIPGLASSAQPNQAMSMGLNPNAGLAAGTSGYVNANYQPVGPTPGTGNQVTPGQISAFNQITSATSQIGRNIAQATRAQQTPLPTSAGQDKGSAAPSGPAPPAPPPGPGQVPLQNSQQATLGDLMNRMGTQNIRSMTVSDLMLRFGLMRQ